MSIVPHTGLKIQKGISIVIISKIRLFTNPVLKISIHVFRMHEFKSVHVVLYLNYDIGIHRWGDFVT